MSETNIATGQLDPAQMEGAPAEMIAEAMLVIGKQIASTYLMVQDKENVNISAFVDINKVNSELDAVVAKYQVQKLTEYSASEQFAKTAAQKEKEALERIYGEQEFTGKEYRAAHEFDIAVHKPEAKLTSVTARGILNDSDYIDSPFVIQNAANLHAAGLDTLKASNPLENPHVHTQFKELHTVNQILAKKVLIKQTQVQQ